MLNRRPLIATGALVALVVTACASGDTGSSTPDGPGTSPRLADTVGFATFEASTEVVDFGDEYRHFVVTTDGSGLAAELEVDVHADLDVDVDGDAWSLAGETIVHLADGAIVVDIPAGALVAVAADETETAAVAVVARAADVLVAFVVEDTSGTVGVRGARYVYTEAGLYPLDGGDAVGDTIAIAQVNAVVGAPVDERVVAAITDLDTTVEVTLVGPGIVAVTTTGDGSDLNDVQGVADVVEEVLFQLNGDPHQASQWHIDNTGAAYQANGKAGTPGVDTGADHAWDVATGSGVIVAVIDSGIQLDHPDLAGRLHANTRDTCGNGVDDDANGFVDDCAGWDFGDNDANAAPNVGTVNYGHGTHVAGIIAAGRNGVGVVGVAPDATIMNLKANRYDGAISTSYVAAAINYATANGADVINMSLGTSPGTPRSSIGPLESAVANAVAAGVVVVVAGGNNGANISSADVWPASLSKYYSGVITVGASTNTDVAASFSNYGTPISVWAPGDQILSTGYGSTYEWKSGTSMAAPVVAGAAAVVLSNGAVTPAAMRAHLQNTAIVMPAGRRVDVAAAVGVSRSAAVTVTYRDVHTLTSDTAGTFSIDVKATGANDATQMRLSVATRDGVDIAAVSGLAAKITVPGGAMSSLVTASDGSYPAVQLGSGVASGVSFPTTMTLPAGDYALVTELLTSAGTRLGGVQVAYVTIDDDGSDVVPTTIAQNPIPTTTVASGGGSSGTGGSGGGVPQTPTTTVPAGSGTGGGAGGSGSGGGSPIPTTTVRPGGGSGSTGGGSTPSTTVPANGGSGSTGGGSQTLPTVPTGGGSGGGAGGGSPTPITTLPRVTPTTVPSSGGSGSSPTPTTTVAPKGGATSTTQPAPPLATDGSYSIRSLTPKTGRIAGSENVTLVGKFPTFVPVYVWFGDQGVVQAHFNNGGTLIVRTPQVQAPIVTSVIVKFTTTRTHQMTLPNAFTFTGSVTGGGNTPSTTAPSGSGSGGSGGSGGGVPSTTVPSGGGSGGGSGGSGGGVPSTTVPSGGGSSGGSSGGSGSGVSPDWPRSRGELTLRPTTAGTALSLLSIGNWPTFGCQAATCGTSNI